MYQLRELEQRGAEAVLEHDRQAHARPVAGLDDRGGARRICLDRLLEQHVLAGRRGLVHQIGVRPRRGEDEHRVDRAVAEDPVERVDDRHAPCPRGFVTPRGRRRECGGDLHAIDKIPEAQRVRLERHPESDDSEAVH